MQIINESKNTILAKEAIVADTLFKRIKGLLGKRAFQQGQALIIKPCNSIHTFFMRFSIDVLFVDKNNRVIKIIPGLKPYRLTCIYVKASFAVEFPAGTIQATATTPGDILLLFEKSA